MSRSRIGPVVTILIVAGVALVFVFNREPSRPTSPDADALAKPSPEGATGAEPRPKAKPAGFREYPIGDEVTKHHMEIAAVWLPSVGMAGMAAPGDDVIHLEADVHATADNPNGFAKDEFVPYLKIQYEVVDAAGKPLQSGDLMPMVAADGLHYGANIARPVPGRYRLIFKVDPPADVLGRHTDPATGVAPWWGPFEAAFDWTMERPEAPAGARTP